MHRTLTHVGFLTLATAAVLLASVFAVRADEGIRVGLPMLGHGDGAASKSGAIGPRPGDPDWPAGPRAGEGCRAVGCHDLIENVTVDMGFDLSCVFCHGGNAAETTVELAHVQPTRPVIMDKTVAPLDYDLRYQQFVNPSNLRVVSDTCGVCHPSQVTTVMKSMMATAAGHYAGGMYLNGVIDSKTPEYATFAITDDDGTVPTEAGAVASLADLIIYDPLNDPSLVSTHFQAVPSQACARCHLWSRGKGFRGAVGADGTYRADGCAACHMVYADDGRSLSADLSIDHVEQGHPKVHRITKAIPTEQCLHCHHRGARIGLSFTGRSQMPPDLPSGPGVVGTTDVRFNGNFHYVDPETNPPDIHGERGMHCIDCHTKADAMGDGNIYGHMDQATKIACQTCHGTPTARASLVDFDNIPLDNVARDPDGRIAVTSKVDGSVHRTFEAMDITDPSSPFYNPVAACAMNGNHLKDNGGLECFACHTSWTPNCFGCHFERNEQLSGLNLMTREMEVGKASTNNKMFVALQQFMLGANSAGRISPYIVGCQPIADVTAPDGSKILDFAMPGTVNGKSGLAMQPVNPHTIRGPGEVRTCAECHRAPASLGLGSGNYSLARTHAYVAGTSGVGIFNRWDDPTTPASVGSAAAGTVLAVATLPDVVSGKADYLYVARGPGGVDVYNMTGGVPGTLATTIPGINAIDVSRAARFLYVVVAGVGVEIYDNDNPEVATYLATIPAPSAVRAVPWGIHLFIAAGSGGLLVADISDHTMPAIVGDVPGINAADVTLYAHYQNGSAFASRAYVADPDVGVHVIDLLPDFSSPSLANTLPLVGAAGLDTYSRYLITDGAIPSREHFYLYVAAGQAGLHVFDITDPDAITFAGAAQMLGGVAMDVDVSSQINPPGVDDYALVANSTLGLQVVNVTDPTAPSILATVASPGATRVFVDVQQLDRFLDEQGNELKENSHPFVQTLCRDDIVRILATDISTCGCAFALGDVNGDGTINGDDIAPFTRVVLGQAGPTDNECAADLDNSAAADFADVDLFVTKLLSQN